MSRVSRSVSFAFLILILLSRVGSGQNCPNQPVNSSPAPGATGVATTTSFAWTATVEISGYVPGQTAAAFITKELLGNEFIQIPKLLQDMNLGTAYNARVTVKVIGGSGKVSAYGSMIDNQTQDPTYVPAQQAVERRQ
jgi:hypothetical protein